MQENGAGPANVIHDTTGPAPGIDAPRHETAVRVAVLEAIPRVVTVEPEPVDTAAWFRVGGAA